MCTCKHQLRCDRYFSDARTIGKVPLCERMLGYRRGADNATVGCNVCCNDAIELYSIIWFDLHYQHG